MGLFFLSTMEKHMLKRWPLLLAAALLPVYASAQSSLTSFLPQKDLGVFLASNFDLHSIRSSFGPRHATGLHSFADFGLKPHKVTADSVEFRENEWLYRLTIGARGDMNSDGIEDVVVCLFEQREGVGGPWRPGAAAHALFRHHPGHRDSIRSRGLREDREMTRP